MSGDRGVSGASVKEIGVDADGVRAPRRADIGSALLTIPTAADGNRDAALDLGGDVNLWLLALCSIEGVSGSVIAREALRVGGLPRLRGRDHRADARP
jgi:hypothetical protein